MTRRNVPQDAEECNSLTDAEDEKFRALIQQAKASDAAGEGRSDASISAGLKTTVDELVRALKGEPSPVNVRIREAIAAGALPLEPQAPSASPAEIKSDDVKVWITSGETHTQRIWPEASETPWPALRERLMKHGVGPKEGSCFVPAAFGLSEVRGDDGVVKDERRRRAGAVDAISVLVFDLDTGGVSIDEAKNLITKQGVEAVIYTTHSHTDDKPRFRVVVPLARPWRASAFSTRLSAQTIWKRFYLKTAAELGFEVDKNCVDLCRLFYDGRHDEGKPFRTEHIRGKPLEADFTPLSEAERERSVQSQASLRGNPDVLDRGMAALPNDAEFNDRGEYIEIAHACRGAYEDGPRGFDAFTDWAARWAGADPDYDERTWAGITEPRLGADYIYRLAIKHSGGKFTREDAMADAAHAERKADWRESRLPAPESVFTKVADDRPARAVDGGAGEAYNRLPRMASVFGGTNPSAIPTRNWLIYPWLPASTAATLVGAPKVGKSSFSLRLAMIVATGDESALRGKAKISQERLHKQGPVIVYDAEDTVLEMQRRLAGLEGFHGIKIDDVHLWSGCDDPLVIATKGDSKAARVVRAPECAMLIEAIREHKPALVIVGPLGSLSKGTDENDNDDMGAVISIIRKIAEDENTTILVIQHTGKSEIKDDLNAGRGASAVIGGVRGGIVMAEIKPDDPRLKERPNGRYVRLGVAGSNYGAKMDGLMFRVRSAPVGNGTGEPLPASAAAMFDDDDAEAALKRNGDTVVVHELIDANAAGIRAEAAQAGEDETRRKAIAALALAVLGERAETSLSAIWPELGGRLQQAGLIATAKRRETVSTTITQALGGAGVTVRSDGQLVRVWVEKEGGASNSPWILRQEAAPTDSSEEACTALHSDDAVQGENIDK